MEFSLRCNTLKCRTPLTERAVVTTCSHIFCLDCANNLKLATTDVRNRHCPACKESLPHPDDAVTTVLTPTEDYKTSVLSGLDPNTIMECAGRALAFWTYQTTQEIFYQQFLGKNLTEKYGVLSSQMDKIVQEANTEIETCQRKIESLQVGTKTLQEEKNDLVRQFQAKSARHSQTQKLYEQLKSKVRMSGVPAAALQSADMVVHPPRELYNIDNPRPDRNAAEHIQHQPYPFGISNDAVRSLGQGQLHNRGASGSGSIHSSDYAAMPPPQRSVAGQRSHAGMVSTPQHRSQLTGPLRTAANRTQIPQASGRFNPQSGGRRSNPSYTPQRHSQSASGYGISAGMKVGSAPGSRLGTSVGSNAFPAHSLVNNLTNGLGGAFATGPAFPGNHFS